MKLNRVQFWVFDSMTLTRNETHGIRSERSGRNLIGKSGTDRDFKRGENCSVFWIGTRCPDHSGRNGMELTTLL